MAIWSEAAGTYTFAWTNGYTDTLTLSASGALSGTNNVGNTTTGSPTACPTSTDPVVGCYAWFNGGTVEVLASGALVQTGLSSGPVVATWTDANGTYTFAWANGYTDTLTLSASGGLSGNIPTCARIPCSALDSACPSASCTSGSSSGGSSASCHGSAQSCAQNTTQSGCGAEAGCTWAPATCKGNAASCSNFSDLSSCASQGGCVWSGLAPSQYCAGTPTSCNQFGQSGCLRQEGCSWSSAACGGTPEACSAIGSSTTCGAQPGCSWY